MAELLLQGCDHFETNLRSEIWAIHIGAALGVDVDHVEKVVKTTIAGARSQLAG